MLKAASKKCKVDKILIIIKTLHMYYKYIIYIIDSDPQNFESCIRKK